MGMKFKSDVKMMGVEFGQYDGKPYWKVGLMQGLDSRVFYLDQQDYDKLYNVPVGSDISINVEITDRNGRTYFKLVDYQIKPVSEKKTA